MALASDSPQDVMVITGTKTEKNLVDAPIRTEVVTAAELERNHAQDLAEAIQNVPGLTLVNIHGRSGQEVWIQGIDAKRVLILMDGMPISGTSGAVDLTQITLANVKQIEVAKGALSALYGSEAMGGVVNIITKTPQEPVGFSVTADTGGYGSNGLRNDYFNDGHIKVQGHKRWDQFYIQLAADHRDKGGVDLDPSTFPFEGASGTKTGFSGVLGYEFENGGHLKLSPSWYQEDLERNFDEFTPGIGYVDQVKSEVITRQNTSINYTGAINEDIFLTTYYINERVTEETKQTVVSSNNVNNPRFGELNSHKAEAQIDFALGSNHVITTGIVGYQADLVQTKNGVSELKPENPSRTNYEYYIQDDFFVTDSFELLPGVRAQTDSDFGSHFSPKLNAMYRPASLSQYNVRVRGGVGAGYRVPTLKERYYEFDHSSLGYMVLGNPELQPESSVSYQLGIDAQFSKLVWGELSLYRNDIKDLIAEDLNADKSTPDLQIYEYMNMARALTQGFDASVRVSEVSGWSGNVGYSFLHAEDKDTGKTLVRRPKHQLKFSVNYLIAAINTNLTLLGRAESESYADSANTLVSPANSIFDFKINSQITDQIKVFAGVDNLTNTVRDTPSTGNDFRPTEGRYIYAGATYTY
ncbi:TonB-dependent receptor plug domain-containing protein [Vibrio maritimus]